jgi:nucleoside-diphosphate-sugar epimerase
MMATHRVLVTGSAGAIDIPVCRELARRGHVVRGFDRVPSPDVEDSLVGEIEDAGAVERAVRGVDSVVHLAAYPNDADFHTLIGPNVLGLYHVMNAARHAALRRVVLASSVQTVMGKGRQFSTPYSVDESSPGNHYALTKVWAEQMGAMYARVWGMSVIAARVCWMVRSPAEAARMLERQASAHYLSRGDAGRFFACAIEAEHSGFSVLYATGPDGGERVDLERSRRLIGYEPQDRWPEGLPFEVPRG